MAESPDYKELLQLLNESDVDYLIVGGFAVMKYGEPIWSSPRARRDQGCNFRRQTNCLSNRDCSRTD